MKLIKINYSNLVKNNCDLLLHSSKLVKKAHERTLTHAHVACYLKNLEVLFAKNISTIEMATDVYQGTTYGLVFNEKLSEERGHDQWAKKDLASFNFNVKVVPELVEFTNFLHETMLKSPKTYIFYFYYAEFLTSYLGPEWMGLLNESLGIQASEVTALSKHVELDGGHADEMLELLSQYEWSKNELEDLDVFAQKLHEGYSKLFNAIAEFHCDSEVITRLPSAS